MMKFLVTCITALGVIYTFVSLGLTYFKSRLPFRQTIVRRTELARASPKMSLLVYHVYFDWPVEKSWVSAIGFLFGTHDPGKVVNSDRYARLSSFYSAGRTFRLHYVPRLEWLFPPIAETPFLQADIVLTMLAGAASTATLYMILSGSVRF
jgi:hypothetical protein